MGIKITGTSRINNSKPKFSSKPFIACNSKYIANAHKLLEYKLDSSVSTALDQAPSGFILQVVIPRVNVPNDYVMYCNVKTIDISVPFP